MAGSGAGVDKLLSGLCLSAPDGKVVTESPKEPAAAAITASSQQNSGDAPPARNVLLITGASPPEGVAQLVCAAADGTLHTAVPYAAEVAQAGDTDGAAAAVAAMEGLASRLPAQTSIWVRVVVVVASSSAAADNGLPCGAALRSEYPSAFLVLWHASAVEDAQLRMNAFAAGYNMVTCFTDDLEVVLRRIGGLSRGGNYACGECGLGHLSSDDMWVHQPLWHIHNENYAATCPCCRKPTSNMAVHIHEAHHPGGPKYEQRRGLGAAIVVHRRRDNKFLMVQEFACQGYWVPGGGTDIGEALTVSGVRECLEEAGVRVELKGVIDVSYTVDEIGRPTWRLVTFYAEYDDGGPSADATNHAKTVPDFESAGACWVSAEELDSIPLRSERIPKEWFPYFAGGGLPQPLRLPADVAHLFTDVHF